MFDKRLYLRNIVANTLYFAISVILTFAVTPYIVSTLGDYVYGYWSIIISVLIYFSFFDLGFQSALGHYVSRHLSEGDEASLESKINSALFFFIWVAIACTMGGAILALYLPGAFGMKGAILNSARIGIFLAIAAAGLRFATCTFQQILVGLQRFDLFSGVLLATRLLNTGFTLIALKYRPGLASMGMAFFLSTAFESLLFMLFAKSQLKGIRLQPFRFTHSAFVVLWQYGVYSFLINITTQLSLRVGPLIIAWKMGAAAVTYYGIGSDLIPYMMGITSAIAQPLLQIIIPMDVKKKTEDIRQLMLSGTRYVFAVVTLLSVNIFLGGPRFLGQWMGEKYLFDLPFGSSGDVLLILGISLLLSQSSSVAHQILFARRVNNLFAILTITETILFLILAFFLVKPFGILGIAFAAMLPKSISEGIFVPLLTTHQIGMPIGTYVRHAILPNLLAMAATLSLGILLRPHWHWDGWLGVFGLFTLVSLLHLGFLGVFVLEKKYFLTAMFWLSKVLRR